MKIVFKFILLVVLVVVFVFVLVYLLIVDIKVLSFIIKVFVVE